jgi:O-antigen/teichoic acid export membrane protein
VAKDQKRAASWLGNILILKIPLAILSLAAVFILINFLNYDPLTRTLVYISAISMVLDSFTTTFFSTVRGFHNLKYESISSIIFQLVVLVVGYGALLMGQGLTWALAALALASLYNFSYSLFVVVKKIKIPLRFLYDQPLVKEILKISWPFAAYAIFQRLYTYFDSVLLSVLAGDEQVGLYQVAFKIIFALQFLPMAFTASLYPAMSAYWHSNRAQLAVSFERAMNYLIIISLPIIVGCLVLSDKIILLFKAGYGGAKLPLEISIISLFFIFLNFPVGSLLNACDRQRRNTWNMGIVTVLSVLMNLALIPHFKAVGASLTVLTTNILMFGLGLYWVRKIIPYRSRKNLLVLLKVLSASLAMGLIIWIGKNYLNVFIITIIGALIYFSALFWFGGFSKADIMSVWQSFRRRDLEAENEANLTTI